jgi:hypothetical protein
MLLTPQLIKSAWAILGILPAIKQISERFVAMQLKMTRVQFVNLRYGD